MPSTLLLLPPPLLLPTINTHTQLHQLQQDTSPLQAMATQFSSRSLLQPQELLQPLPPLLVSTSHNSCKLTACSST